MFDSDASNKFRLITGNLSTNRDITVPAVAQDSTFAFLEQAQTFSAAQTFDNYIDSKIISAPGNPASGYGRVYSKQIDSNNDGLFVKIQKAGGFVEVQIA